MRKLILPMLLLLGLVSCDQDVKEENARLEAQNEELQREAAQKDSLLNDFVEDFSRIQENLASIREKEEEIAAAREADIETSLDQREEVIRDIEIINELLDENRRTIADLNDKLSRYQNENSKLKQLTANLQSQVETKDAQIGTLKENLAAVNFEMEALNSRLSEVQAENEERAETIEEQRERLNTAYYAIGTYADLEENKVIDKKGGLLGIGRTKTLAKDFNRDYFTKIDITNTNTIPLNNDEDDIKLITSHPTDSYEFKENEEKVTSLEITDPEKFWKSSKYLVVLVD